MEQQTENHEQNDSVMVKSWLDKIRHAEGHHYNAFQQIRENQRLARTGAQRGYDTQVPTDPSKGKYKVNLTKRVLSRQVGAVYATNPTPLAMRRKRIENILWDGTVQHLNDSQMIVREAEEKGGDAMLSAEYDFAKKVIDDYYRVKTREAELDRFGLTLTTLFMHYMDNPVPLKFKRDMKNLVRTAKVDYVGFVKFDYYRNVLHRPDPSGDIQDVSNQVAEITRLEKDTEMDADEKREKLKLAREGLEKSRSVETNEGLVLTYPETTTIIIDPCCKNLRDFKGARWLAQKYMLPYNDIKKFYPESDITKENVREYTMKGDAYEPGDGEVARRSGAESLCKVYEVYCRTSGMVYCIADGYKRFLRKPMPPNVSVEGMFPFMGLVFDEAEDSDGNIYHESTIQDIQHIQYEYNRQRESARQHRIANTPRYLAESGSVGKEERKKLESSVPHDVVYVKGQGDGRKLNEIFVAIEHKPLDPALYDVAPTIDDLYHVAGLQPAQLGNVSKATATETSIAQSGIDESDNEDVDTINDFMSGVFHVMGDILIDNMPVEKVRQIVGEGAFWPEGDAREFVRTDLFMSIRAGSTARPNAAKESRIMERMANVLVQIPGLSPIWLAEKMLKILDSNIDLTRALDPTQPSIVAMNQLATGDPGTDPRQQGGQGANKNPNLRASGTLDPGGNNQVK